MTTDKPMPIERQMHKARMGPEEGLELKSALTGVPVGALRSIAAASSSTIAARRSASGPLLRSGTAVPQRATERSQRGTVDRLLRLGVIR